MGDPDSEFDDPDHEALRAAIGEAYHHRVEIPPSFDEEVLARAELPLARLRRRRLLRLAIPAAAGLAAAASLTLLVFTGEPAHAPDGPATRTPHVAADHPATTDARTVHAEPPAVVDGRTTPADPGPAPAPHDAAPAERADAAGTPAETVATTDIAAPAENTAGDSGSTAPRPPGDPRSDPPRRRGDLDGDGRVDVIDAFLLARRIEAADAADPSWDLSGDGRVDRFDVDRVASLAVSLAGGDR